MFLRLTGAFAALLFFGNAFAQTPLVTGNGHGYAVVDAKSGALVRFYAHPYRFTKPPADVKDDGPTTVNFIKSASWTGLAVSNVSYVDQSHVIRSAGAKSAAHFFMPFTLERNVLVTSTDASNACFSVTWQNPVASRRTITVGGLKADVVKFTDVEERLLVVPLGAGISGAGISGAGEFKPAVSKFCGHGFALISVENDGQIQAAVSDFENWRKAQSGHTLMDRELRALEKWRVPPALPFAAKDARELWRQSETILRMAQIRERSHRAFGLINASLPIGDWFIPWVRDMSYATAALIRMGHREEARLAMNAYYNAGPIGTMQAEVRGVPYQISLTRYFGDGSEETDHSGAPYANLEFDDWGLALWVTGEYFAKYKDVAWLNSPAAHGTVYETARDYVIKPLLANLDPVAGGGKIFAADSSCWEQNWVPRQHYAFSNIAGIGGLKAFLPLAQAMGDIAAVGAISSALQEMEKGFQSAFVKNTDVRGTLENSATFAIDGALLEGIKFGAIHDPAQVKSTLDRMQLLMTASGGYRRILGTGEYESHEFLFINFLLARVEAAMGDLAAADALVERMQKKASADNNMIPEMYVSRINNTYTGPIGSPAGSMPMVGYGAGAYILYFTERP